MLEASTLHTSDNLAKQLQQKLLVEKHYEHQKPRNVNNMKTLKLVFYEKKTVERDDGSPVSMDFKGNWDNNSEQPEITFRITKCNEETSMAILEELGLETPGEAIFLMKGKNPQIRLDDFLAKAEKRRTSQVDNFKKEIEDFDHDMLRVRYEKITEELDEMIKEKQTESKRFDFYFDCFGVIYEKYMTYPSDISKEEYIKNHSYEEAINGSKESEEDNTGDIDDYTPDDDIYEEE